MKQVVKYIKPILDKRYIGYLGAAGLLCLLISGIAWLFQAQFGAISAVFSIIGLACVLAYIIIDFKNIQAQFSKRSVKYGANVTLMILIVLGIAALVEGISGQHNFRVDLTKNQRFTLSEQTKKVLNALNKDIKIIAFFRLSPEPPRALKDLLDQYTRLSPRITYEFVDPVTNPGIANKYEIRSLGTIVLEAEAEQEKFTETSEEALTNGLIKVTREEKKVVYFLKGHGERNLEDSEQKGYKQAKEAIEDEHYEVKELLLVQQQSVPEDADVLIIAGPENDFFPAELELLKSYIQQGGKIMFLLDPEYAQGMLPFLKDYGILLGDDVVVDPKSRVFLFGPPTYEIPIVTAYQDHQIVEKLKEFEIPTIFPLARSIQIQDSLPAGVTARAIASSNAQSWVEISKEEWEQGAVEFTKDQDHRGPIPLVAVVTVKADAKDGNPDNTAKLVVCGDADFASNNYFRLSGAGNENFFLNAVSWLAGEEDLISIRPKDSEMVPLMLTYPQGVLAFLISVVILPLVVAGVGITVLVKRRQATR